MLAEKTDWTSMTEQQIWFDKFKCKIDDQREGINFCQFQELLNATIYKLFSVCQPDSPDIFSSDLSQVDDSSKFSHEQELHLFNIFDTKGDHMIDREEFVHLCRSWLDKIYQTSSALVIVDVQNDFIDGSLALINAPAGQDGVEVIPSINDLLETCQFDAVVYTKDWHPVDHIAFYDNLHLRKHRLKVDKTLKSVEDEKKENLISNRSGKCDQVNIDANNDISNNNHNGNSTGPSQFRSKKFLTNVKLYDVVLFDDDKVEQKLWPTHCIQNSWGAELHPKLKIAPDAIIIHKGSLSNVDAYSAFWDNSHLNETGLRQDLQARGVNEAFFCGLALDYCVGASAMDSIKSGFLTCVIEDACRGIDDNDIKKRRQELKENGVILTSVSAIQDYFLLRYILRSGELDRSASKRAYSKFRSMGEIGALLKEMCYQKGVLLTKCQENGGNSSIHGRM